MRYQGPQDRGEASKADCSSQHGQGEEGPVAEAAHESLVHSAPLDCRSRRRSIACASAITVNVIRNSSSPSAINDEV